MQALQTFRDKHIIKILSGVRRAGKSTVLDLFHKELVSSGVVESQIIERRYTSMDFAENFDERSMYADLKGAVALSDRKCYLLLDEVQEVDNWEKVINSIFESSNADIYITGSNSKLLSSEISTYLSGRFVSIPVFTLSFSEYLEFQYRCRRYDMQGKEVLKTQEKFYLSDVSFKYSQLGFNTKMIASVLENIVYLELRRRGHEVYIGKLGNREIDFVAINRGEKLYVQVCRNLIFCYRRTAADSESRWKSLSRNHHLTE